MNSKERFMAVIQGDKPDRVPIFPLLMDFAAKRYGLSYREYASYGHLLAESQLHCMDLFPLDAITACSDAFRLAADLGGEIVFPEETPPYLATPLVRDERDFKSLKRPQVDLHGRMGQRISALETMVKEVGEETMVLGWIDMPFAEASSICGVGEFMLLLYDNPRLAEEILEFLTPIVIEFALAQLETGAPMVGAGDAVCSLISPDLYREWALPYERQVCQAIHEAHGLVKLHICGNTENHLALMMESGADLYNIDHMVDFSLAVETYGGRGRPFKGNLDPVSHMLQASEEECFRRAKECIQRVKGYSYMLSAGCEIPAAVTDEVFWAFVHAVSDDL